MGTTNKLKNVNLDNIKIGQVQIKPIKMANNLGVMYEKEGNCYLSCQESSYD